MKFIADGMLGKLSRWLRMLGYDVEYSFLNDNQLIDIAKHDGRTLLTCDLELYQRAIAHGVEVFLIEGKNGVEKLTSIAKRFDVKLEIDPSISRCPKCNARVKPIQKENIMEKVQNSTFLSYNKFWECPGCGKIYWQGAHWNRIQKTLQTAKNMMLQR